MMRSLVLLLAFLSSTVAFAPSPSRVFSVAKFDVRPAQPLFMSSEEPTEETKISADGTYFDDEVSTEGKRRLLSFIYSESHEYKVNSLVVFDPAPTDNNSLMVIFRVFVK